MKTFPIAQGTKLQALLDEGDQRFFANNPDQTERRRFYFRGEQVLGGGKTSRYIIVSRDADGRLVRRFLADGGAV